MTPRTGRLAMVAVALIGFAVGVVLSARLDLFPQSEAISIFGGAEKPSGGGAGTPESRAEAETAERQPKPRKQYGAEHCHERRLASRKRGNGAKQEDERNDCKRHNSGGYCDREESVRSVKRGSDGRPDGKRRVHRGADPGDNLPRVLRRDDCEPPS